MFNRQDGSIKVTRTSRAPPRHLFGASPNVVCLLRLFPFFLQATPFFQYYLRVASLVVSSLTNIPNMSEEDKTVCIGSGLQL